MMKKKSYLFFLCLFYFALNSKIYSNHYTTNWSSFSNYKIHSNFLKENLNRSKKIQFYYNIYFNLETAISENSDLSNLDESNEFSISSTDDRLYWGFYQVGFSLALSMGKNFFLYSDIFQEGLLGNNPAQYGNKQEKNYIASARIPEFGNLFIEKIIIKKDNFISIRLGRQLFQISENIFHREYILKSYLDSIVITYSKPNAGILRFLLVDFQHSYNNHLYRVNYIRYFFPDIGTDRSEEQNFRGENLSLRFGIVYESPNFLDIKQTSNIQKDYINLTLYGFYVYYGAVSLTGRDISQTNNLYNRNDKDWIANSGTRLSFNHKIFSLYVDINYSFGIDNKNFDLVFEKNFSHTVKANGVSFILSLFFKPISIVKNYQMDFGIDFIYKQGASYSSEGLLSSYGFVGFESDRIGGILLRDYWGVYSNATAKSNGFYYDPYNFQRAAGTMSLYLQLSQIIFQYFTIHLESWILWHTGGFPTQSIKNIENLVDTSKSHTFMGVEMDVSFIVSIQKYWDITFSFGIFFPAEFYSFPRVDIANPSGRDNFWIVKLNSVVNF